jgi:hypothetical protein
LEAYVPAKLLEQLQKTTFKIEVIEDATLVGEERQKEVGVGDRFRGGSEVPAAMGVMKERKP